jgi:hypothetical protein
MRKNARIDAAGDCRSQENDPFVALALLTTAHVDFRHAGTDVCSRECEMDGHGHARAVPARTGIDHVENLSYGRVMRAIPGCAEAGWRMTIRWQNCSKVMGPQPLARRSGGFSHPGRAWQRVLAAQLRCLFAVQTICYRKIRSPAWRPH